MFGDLVPYPHAEPLDRTQENNEPPPGIVERAGRARAIKAVHSKIPVKEQMSAASRVSFPQAHAKPTLHRVFIDHPTVVACERRRSTWWST